MILTKSIRGVNGEKENRQTSTIPRRSFHVLSVRSFNVRVVDVAKGLLCSECMRCAHRRDHFFCHGSTVCDVLQ